MCLFRAVVGKIRDEKEADFMRGVFSREILEPIQGLPHDDATDVSRGIGDIPRAR